MFWVEFKELSVCWQECASSPGLISHIQGVLSKGLVGEGVQLHREEKVFLVPGTGAEIRQVLGKKSRGMIFLYDKNGSRCQRARNWSHYPEGRETRIERWRAFISLFSSSETKRSAVVLGLQKCRALFGGFFKGCSLINGAFSWLIGRRTGLLREDLCWERKQCFKVFLCKTIVGYVYIQVIKGELYQNYWFIYFLL